MKKGNSFPSDLNGHKRPTVGLIFMWTQDSYESAVWKSVVEQAEKYDVNLLCFSIGDLLRGNDLSNTYHMKDILDLINPDLIDGFLIITTVFLTTTTVEHMQELFGVILSKPCVSIGVEFPGKPGVYIDNDSGLHELLRHLVKDHGYRKIGFLKGPSANPEFAARFDTYRKTLSEYDIPYDEDLVFTGDTRASSYISGTINKLTEFVNRMESIEAVVCASDTMAIYLTKMLVEKGYRIPEDVAVTGFDDSDACRSFIPPLSTVAQPMYELGERALITLLDQIRGLPVPDKIFLPTRAVIRGSCGCFPFLQSSLVLYSSGIDSDEAFHGDPEVEILLFRRALGGEIKSQFEEKVPSDISREWSERLSGAVISSLGSRTNDIFLKTLSELIVSSFGYGVDASAWSHVVNAVMFFVKPSVKPGADLLRLEESWKSALLIVQDLAMRNILREKEELSKSYYTHHFVTTVLNGALTIEEFKNCITDYFPRVGFESCCVALYCDESRKRSKLIAAYDLAGDCQLPHAGGEFDTVNIVPEGCRLFERRKSWYLSSLYYKDISLGYILMEINQLQGDMYENIPSQLSSAIRSILLMQKVRDHNLELQNLVAERTSELQQANNQLKELDKLKNDFIANITHDFRSPLTVILNLSDLAMRFDKNTGAKEKEKFDIIFKSSLRLKNSIDKLLELAKIDSKGIKLKIERIDPVSFLETLLDYYGSSVMSSGIEIVKDLPGRRIEDFYTDSEKLEQILDNLLSNAVKFVDPQRGVITVRLRDLKDFIEIRITDNGIGIPRDKLSMIFNRFEQAHEGINSRYHGTGIGLAFVIQLTKLLSGEIDAFSEGEGRGASFVLKLKKGRGHFEEKDLLKEKSSPRNRGDTRKLIEADLEERMNSRALRTIFSDHIGEDELDHKKGKILIIDDDKNICDIIMRYLFGNGFENFIIASDGKQGLDAVYEYFPDVVICDYNMPNMKGDEFHNRLAGNPKHCKIPLIFLSAVADERLILERREIGAAAYLKKPIEEKLLVITVEEQLKKYLELKRITRQATIDELTGLDNRRSVIEHLQRELSVRKYRDISVLFFDIDNFKEINDGYGHQAGDIILSMIGKIIKNSIRKSDIAGRYGGDEFLVILPETGLNEARHVAYELGRTISMQKVQYQDKTISITSSFGISSLRDNAAHIETRIGINNLAEIYEVRNKVNADWKDIENKKDKVSELLIEMADAMLYQSKKTICKKCGYSSEKKNGFPAKRCPECASDDLEIGRNRISSFE